MSGSPSRVSTSSSDNRNRLFTNEDSHLFDLLGKDEEVEVEDEEGGLGGDDAGTSPPCTQEATAIRHGAPDPQTEEEEEEEIVVDPRLERERQDEAAVEDLTGEVERLRNVLLLEEKMLREEASTLRSSLGDQQALTLRIEEMEEEKKDIDREIDLQTERCTETSFLLEAKQRKLLKGLRNIYPIRSSPGTTTAAYSIAGIHLPHDLHTPAAPDESISAGLGYACHLVSLIGEYLSVPLRYRLVCNSSRSAVRDDDDLFPLFREKVVTRVQLDRAVVLLGRNVDLLLGVRGIGAAGCGSHVLAKLEVFFEKMVEMDGDVDGDDEGDGSRGAPSRDRRDVSHGT